MLGQVAWLLGVGRDCEALVVCGTLAAGYEPRMRCNYRARTTYGTPAAGCNRMRDAAAGLKPYQRRSLPGMRRVREVDYGARTGYMMLAAEHEPRARCGYRVRTAHAARQLGMNLVCDLATEHRCGARIACRKWLRGATARCELCAGRRCKVRPACTALLWGTAVRRELQAWLSCEARIG